MIKRLEASERCDGKFGIIKKAENVTINQINVGDVEYDRNRNAVELSEYLRISKRILVFDRKE